MYLDSPQQNGIAERRIGLAMEVARTSMIHTAAPHFLWPFVVRYAAHQLNLWPRVPLPETSPTLRWTGEVGDASVFWVWGSRAFVRDTSVDKLSSHAIPCIFLGFVPDAHSWQFYHPTLRRVFPSHDVTFDESVPFYRLFPYRSAPPPPQPLFLAPGPPPVAVGSGAARGAASGGAASGGAASGGAEPGGVGSEGAGSGGGEQRGQEPGGAEPEGVDPRGAESEGAEPRGAASSGGPASASPRLSRQQLCVWLVRRACLQNGATGAGDARAGGAGVTAGAGGTGGTAAAGPGGARTGGVGAAGTGGVGGARAGDPTEPRAAGAGGSCAGGAGAGGAGVGVTSAGGAGAGGAGAVDSGAGGAGGTSGDLTERRELVSRPVSLVRAARRVPRSRPPPVPGTHAMALRPSSSDRARAASPPVSRLLATTVTDPFFLSSFASPPTVGGECALGTDFLEDNQEDFECLAAAVPRFASMLLSREGDLDAPNIPTPRSYAEAITGPYSSQWQAAMDAEMASWKSIGTYVDEVPPPEQT
ncbi:unnamed protein product [Closterium sp. NIES-54]